MDKVQCSSVSQGLLKITSNIDELSLARLNDARHPPKSLSHFTSGQRRENIRRGSWVEIMSRRPITQQIPSWTKQARIWDINRIYY